MRESRERPPFRTYFANRIQITNGVIRSVPENERLTTPRTPLSWKVIELPSSQQRIVLTPQAQLSPTDLLPALSRYKRDLHRDPEVSSENRTEIGSGGEGIVYRVGETMVAIKERIRQLVPPEKTLASWEAIRIASEEFLQDPSIHIVHPLALVFPDSLAETGGTADFSDLSRDDTNDYIAMEYVANAQMYTTLTTLPSIQTYEPERYPQIIQHLQTIIPGHPSEETILAMMGELPQAYDRAVERLHQIIQDHIDPELATPQSFDTAADNVLVTFNQADDNRITPVFHFLDIATLPEDLV